QERRVEPQITGAAAAGRRYAVLAAAALAVIAVDQVTKTWAEHALRDRTIHIIWTLQLSLTFNSGVAFGLGRGVTPLFVVLAVAIVVAFVGFNRTVPTVGRA